MLFVSSTVYDWFFESKFIRRFIQNVSRDFMFNSVALVFFFLCVVGDEFLVAKIIESSFKKLLNLDIHKREYPGFVPVFIL